jgi:hypothetical protein
MSDQPVVRKPLLSPGGLKSWIGLPLEGWSV